MERRENQSELNRNDFEVEWKKIARISNFCRVAEHRLADPEM